MGEVERDIPPHFCFEKHKHYTITGDIYVLYYIVINITVLLRISKPLEKNKNTAHIHESLKCFFVFFSKYIILNGMFFLKLLLTEFLTSSLFSCVSLNKFILFSACFVCVCCNKTNCR